MFQFKLYMKLVLGLAAAAGFNAEAIPEAETKAKSQVTDVLSSLTTAAGKWVRRK